MRIVDETIEDGICQGGITDGFMPMVDGELACDDGGTPSVPVLDDLQQVPALRRNEDGKPPIVKDQHVEPARALSMRAWRPSPRARASASKRRGAR